jgi:hypothetical protein
MQSNSKVLFNPNERHSGHHLGGGVAKKKTGKSIEMEENQSTLKRMNCKLSSLQILECIRHAASRRNERRTLSANDMYSGSMTREAGVGVGLYALLVTRALFRIKQYNLWISDHDKEMLTSHYCDVCTLTRVLGNLFPYCKFRRQVTEMARCSEKAIHEEHHNTFTYKTAIIINRSNKCIKHETVTQMTLHILWNPKIHYRVYGSLPLILS